MATITSGRWKANTASELRPSKASGARENRGSAGFHAIKKDQTTLDFLAGGNFTDENYTETVITDATTTPPTTASFKVVHNFGALTLGEELMHKVGKSTVLNQKLYFYPNLTERGEYRGTFDLALVTKISKWLGWQNEFNDVYVSNPPPGAK